MGWAADGVNRVGGRAVKAAAMAAATEGATEEAMAAAKQAVRPVSKALSVEMGAVAGSVVGMEPKLALQERNLVQLGFVSSSRQGTDVEGW